MTILILLIPMAICYVLLIIHALYTEGKKFTIAFFGGFLIYAILREFLLKISYSPYSFSSFIPVFQIINIPIAIGWSFTAYISYWFAKWVFRIYTREKSGYHFFLISCISVVITWLIVFAIEFTAPRMGWWNFNSEFLVNQLTILDVYIFLFLGWGGTVLCFLFPFQIMFYRKKAHVPKKEQIASLIFLPLFYFFLVLGNYILMTYTFDLTIYIILILAWLLPVPVILYYSWQKIKRNRIN